MAEVVVNSTSKMSDADVRAIAVYLKDLPAGAPEPAVTPAAAGANGGRREAVYAHACIACHEVDGRARRGSIRRCPAMPICSRPIPPARFASSSTAPQTVTTPRAPNTGSMPAYAEKLSDQADRRCRDLHPQFLGQCRARGDAGAGREGAQR